MGQPRPVKTAVFCRVPIGWAPPLLQKAQRSLPCPLPMAAARKALTGEDFARVKCFINSTCACVHSALERVQGVGGCGQKKLTHAFQQVLPLSQVPLGKPPPTLVPPALCTEHPLPFHLDLPLLSLLVEVERKDRELKRRLSREGREGRTWTEVRGKAQPGGTRRWPSSLMSCTWEVAGG